jgi:hypothetical protein
MSLPARFQNHLESKGVDVSKIKPGVYIPKTVPGITIKRSDQPMFQAVQATALSARMAPVSIFSKQREPGSKQELPSFMKKK